MITIELLIEPLIISFFSHAGIVPAHQAQQQPAAFAQVYPLPPVNAVYERNPYQGNYPPSNYASYSQAPPTVHYASPPQGGGYAPGSVGQGPPSYQATPNYPTQPPQNAGYTPGSTSNNTYQPQYPSVPGQQSSGAYPNIPSYEDATRKNK